MNLRRTSLYEYHVSLGAKMVNFGGWEMPLQYTSIIKEHLAVRNGAGIFDTSHMGEILISGAETENFIDYLITNDFKALSPGRCMYSPMCNEIGGVVDDVIVLKFPIEKTTPKALIIANAANIQKDLAWINSLVIDKNFKVSVEDKSDHYAMLAIQGPKAMTHLSRLLPGVHEMPPFSFKEFSVQEKDSHLFSSITGIFATTGYTGEKGGEIYLKNEHASNLMKILITDGVTACGLGARDSLRLEKGYSLYGHELTEDNNVLEAGLGWVVKMQKTDFIGKKALINFHPQNKLIGFILEDRSIARQGATVWDEYSQIGHVTSGTFSPCLKKNVGLALVNQDFSQKFVFIEIRGQKYRAQVTKRNFV